MKDKNNNEPNLKHDHRASVTKSVYLGLMQEPTDEYIPEELYRPNSMVFGSYRTTIQRSNSMVREQTASKTSRSKTADVKGASLKHNRSISFSKGMQSPLKQPDSKLCLLRTRCINGEIQRNMYNCHRPILKPLLSNDIGFSKTKSRNRIDNFMKSKPMQIVSK